MDRPPSIGTAMNDVVEGVAQSGRDVPMSVPSTMPKIRQIGSASCSTWPISPDALSAMTRTQPSDGVHESTTNTESSRASAAVKPCASRAMIVIRVSAVPAVVTRWNSMPSAVVTA